MDNLSQSIITLDVYFADKEDRLRHAWEIVHAKLVEGQKPTTNKRYTQCPKCGSSRICFWMCRDRYGCYDCDWVEEHST